MPLNSPGSSNLHGGAERDLLCLAALVTLPRRSYVIAAVCLSLFCMSVCLSLLLFVCLSVSPFVCLQFCEQDNLRTRLWAHSGVFREGSDYATIPHPFCTVFMSFVSPLNRKIRVTRLVGVFCGFNPLMGSGNYKIYNAISNNMKLVHWPLMGGLLRLVQR